MKKILALFAILLFSSTVFAQDSTESKGKFSGYVFGDYYYIVKNHKTEIKDQRGLWFRRIYVGYEYQIDDNFSTKLRLEMSNEGDFTSKVAIIPFIKDAWLKYKLEMMELMLGIHSPPSFTVIEKYWKYRSVEKTPLDLQRMATSRDFGISLKGKFDDKGILKYHLMLSNGSSNKEEVNKGKSGLLSLGFYPAKEWIFEIYGDYADQEGKKDWYTLQGFIGFLSKQFWAGIQYADQTRKNSETGDYNLRIGSVYAGASISDHFNIFARVDKMFDPNPEGDKIPFIPFDPTAESTFLVAGIDWQPVKDISFIPNIEFVKYEQNSEGVTPGSDLIGRITFFWKFK